MLGQPILRLDEVDSTNRVALDWEDAPHGAAVVARSQSGGRGRLGRHWSSPPDAGLYLSLILRPEKPENNAILSLMVALGVCVALEKLTKLKFGVKWPNDVLCIRNDGVPLKVGGILCEARGGRIIVGIGVNLNHTSDELPNRPIFEASSLQIESGQSWEVDKVLDAVLRELNVVLAKDWHGLHRTFVRHCFGLGEIIRVRGTSGTVIGIFEAIGDDGALLLRTADGLQRMLAGDVSYF